MTRLAMPHKECVGGDVLGRSYNAKGGFVEVESRSDAQHMKKHAGATISGPLAAPIRTKNIYRCAACAFSTYFKVCGRCGQPTIKETH
jgi:hypothetical protein